MPDSGLYGDLQFTQRNDVRQSVNVSANRPSRASKTDCKQSASFLFLSYSPKVEIDVGRLRVSIYYPDVLLLLTAGKRSPAVGFRLTLALTPSLYKPEVLINETDET